MDYGLEKVIERIGGNFVCVFHGQFAEFSNLEEFEKSDFGKGYALASIRVKDNKIVLELKTQEIPVADADWAKEHEKQFGAAPSFF